MSFPPLEEGDLGGALLPPATTPQRRVEGREGPLCSESQIYEGRAPGVARPAPGYRYCCPLAPFGPHVCEGVGGEGVVLSLVPCPLRGQLPLVQLG